MLGKACPSHYVPMSFIFITHSNSRGLSHAVGRGLRSSLHDLAVYLCSPWLGKSFSGMLSAYVLDIHVLVFAGGRFCLPHDLSRFLLFPMLIICFLCVNGKKWAMILGFETTVLSL